MKRSGDHHIKRAVAGFTIIELMVVLIVLSLAFTIVLINLEGLTPRARIEASSREMAATIIFAREQAIAQGREYRVVFDLTEQTYSVVWKTELDENDEDFVDEDEEDSVELTSLQRGIIISEIITGEDENSSSGEVILAFNEEGISSGIAILFTSEDDIELQYSLRINPVTGYVQFYDTHVSASFIKKDI